jgi:hypothetical protein
VAAVALLIVFITCWLCNCSAPWVLHCADDGVRFVLRLVWHDLVQADVLRCIELYETRADRRDPFV